LLSIQPGGVGDSTDAAESLRIFPNPVHDLLSLRLVNNNTGRVLVMIYDTKGRLIQASIFQKDRLSLECPVDVSRLGQGAYFVQVVSGTGSKVVQKFMKF
jgi:hypothetical protein